MYNQTCGGFGQTIFIQFGIPQQVPHCIVCGQVAVMRTHPDNRFWCGVHFAEIKREIDARANGAIQASIEAIFAATNPDLRKRLYRALAAVWHPDAGGDAALMVALNAVSENVD